MQAEDMANLNEFFSGKKINSLACTQLVVRTMFRAAFKFLARRTQYFKHRYHQMKLGPCMSLCLMIFVAKQWNHNG